MTYALVFISAPTATGSYYLAERSPRSRQLRWMKISADGPFRYISATSVPERIKKQCYQQQYLDRQKDGPGQVATRPEPNHRRPPNGQGTEALGRSGDDCLEM